MYQKTEKKENYIQIPFSLNSLFLKWNISGYRLYLQNEMKILSNLNRLLIKRIYVSIVGRKHALFIVCFINSFSLRERLFSAPCICRQVKKKYLLLFYY